LHWNHDGAAASVIGWIDPATMRETSEGLRVSGKLDIDTSETAREAWRSMKNNAMSLSFGYLTVKHRKRSDGINELHELDLFEISIVPAPANPDTRILEMKSLDVVELADTLTADEMATIRAQAHADMRRLLGANDAALLRAKSERIAREFAPVQIASFQA